MDMAFVEYLRKRRIPEDVIRRMEKEKVDAEAVSCMSTEELKEYLSHEGDRVAVRAYAQRVMNIQKVEKPKANEGTSARPKTPANEPDNKPEVPNVDKSDEDDKKASLMRKLAEKMGFSSGACSSKNTSDKRTTFKSKGHKKASKSETSVKFGNATKQYTKVDIGFSVYDKSRRRFKQVRSNNGGGTRYLELEKPISKQDIIRQAVTAFFPDGTGAQGVSKDFVFDVAADVSGKQLFKEEEHADDFMDRLKMKKMRCYLLASKQDEQSDTSEEETDGASRIGKRKRHNSNILGISSDSSGDEYNLPDCDLTGNREVNVTSHHGASTYSLPASIAGGSMTNNAAVNLHCTETTQSLLLLPCSETGKSTFDLDLPDTTVALHGASQMPKSSSDHEIEFGPIGGSPCIETLEETIVYDPLSTESLVNLIQESDDEHSIPLPTNPTTSEPLGPSPHHSIRSPTPPGDDNATIVTLHRSRIQEEMIAVFMDPAIVDVPIKVRFVDEMGADQQGLSREAYSAFWKEFFLTCTCGENERVPSLFPDYARGEWEAVGRILIKGYLDTGIYPLQLSYAFSVALINGESAVSTDILMDSLRMYLCETDRNVIDKALHGQVLDDDDKDDFLDLLSRVNCHTVPSNDAVRPLILNIAHKELIQEPKYALDAMAATSRLRFQSLFSNPEEVQKMYESKKPTVRNVIKLLESNPADNEEASALSYLKQFIRGLDNEMLKKFLRHVTGADMLCTLPIQVTFNRMRGLGRAPLAHTCGPVLELPSTYANYQEMRKEFLSIIESNYLKMDII